MRKESFQLRPGQVFDRYELLLLVATGGTSQIWAARLRGTRGFEKLVALKTLATPGRENPELERALWHEARLASRIQHPNVAQYFDLIEHEGVLCSTMEWIDGESLSTLLRGSARAGGLPMGLAVQIVVQACKGLQAAHELCGPDGQPVGLVHCDVSPQNLMIDTSGTLKLIDFGIAKVLRARADSDGLFSLGVLLYLLTTGRHPFGAGHSTDKLRAICSAEPVIPPSTICERYPRGLSRVVLRALSPEPAQRFQSAAELLAELVSAFPGHASEVELAHFLRKVCGSSLANRRALVNDALRRSSAAVSSRTGSDPELLGETTPDTLSPAALAVRPIQVPAAPRWRSVRLALISGVLAFAGAFAWAVAQTGPSSGAHSGPAAQPAPVEALAIQSIAATLVASASSSAEAHIPNGPSAAPLNSAATPQLAPAKKRKAVAVRQRYGI